MAKMDTVLTGAGSFASELVGLVRDLRIGLRAQMERTFPGVPFTPGPAFHWPRVKDDESFVAGVAEADEAVRGIGPAALKIFEIIDKLEGDIARFKDETARGGGIGNLRKSGESWDCEDITVYRREAQSYMQKVFAYAATLHFAMQRTLWNIEFIHECPPHPCDDPAASPYAWYGRRGYAENGGGDHDAGSELKIAVDARAAAERAARDAEAEWKVQSERAAELEVQGRQEQRSSMGGRPYAARDRSAGEAGRAGPLGRRAAGRGGRGEPRGGGSPRRRARGAPPATRARANRTLRGRTASRRGRLIGEAGIVRPQAPRRTCRQLKSLLKGREPTGSDNGLRYL